jgi:hypothetical protein
LNPVTLPLLRRKNKPDIRAAAKEGVLLTFFEVLQQPLCQTFTKKASIKASEAAVKGGSP